MNIFISIMKRIVVVFMIILFLVTGYFFLYLKGDKNKLPDLPFIEKTASTTSEISSEDEIIKLQQHLSELKKINIDSGFFNSSVFKSLKNFKEPLPKLKQGRINPFAPMGE